MEDDLTSRLRIIKGKELKYKQLCKELNIDYKRGNAKTAQLKDVGLYCQMQTLDSPTRYLVTEVYDIKELPLNGNNKFQEFLEDLVIQLLKLNNFRILYMTNTQLLMSLYMVNNNYKVLKIPKLRKALEANTKKDYYNLYLAANKSGEILTKWVDRVLTRMEKRQIIQYRTGYCLFKKVKDNGRSYFHKYEVPTSQPYDLKPTMEQRVSGCYNQALNQYSISKNGYIPPELKELFNEKFNELIQEEFNGEWDGGYKVKIIVPSDPKRVKAFQDSKIVINDEAQKKIKATKQLDWMTGEERKRLLDEIISISPSVKYRELVENKGDK